MTEQDRQRFAALYRDAALTDKADVVRQGSPNDGAGGKQKPIPTRVEEGLAAKARRKSNPRTAVEGGRPVVVADWEISLSHPERGPETLDVLPMDTIEVGGGRYRVVGTDRGKTGALRLTVDALKLS